MHTIESRRLIIVACLALSGMMILDSLNVGHAVMMLLIAGQIPGTNYYVDANTMLLALTMIFGILCGRAAAQLLRYARAFSTRPVDA